MVRKKDSIALFEVISKSRAQGDQPGMLVPAWMLKGSQAAQAPPAGVPKATRPIAARREPVVSALGRRLRFSLSYVSCAAVLAGLAAVLVLSFWLGRSTGHPRSQVASVAAAVAPGPLPPADEAAPAGEPAPSQAPSGRQDGKYYMVIQDMRGDDKERADEARRIVEYCRQNGEEATVNLLKDKDKARLVVWSLKPFDLPDDKRIPDHARFIESIGKEYFEKYHTYDFKQQRNGRLDPLLLPYRQPRTGR